MKTDDFHYELPPEAIAQEPALERDRAKLFAHDIQGDVSSHVDVRGLTALLEAGDLLVVNRDARRVFPRGSKLRRSLWIGPHFRTVRVALAAGQLHEVGTVLRQLSIQPNRFRH